MRREGLEDRDGAAVCIDRIKSASIGFDSFGSADPNPQCRDRNLAIRGSQ
jgi:hypothetical protein